MAQVVFDPVAFAAAYPEFTSVAQARSTLMFTIASQSLLDNTNNSPVMDINFRTQLFYMLVAHLLMIFGPATTTTTTPVNTPPGRIDSATQGTITSHFEYKLPEGSAMAAWYVQTKYGAMFWTATAMFRSARYYASGASGIGDARSFSGSATINIPGGV